jgi:hypothetical protein
MSAGGESDAREEMREFSRAVHTFSIRLSIAVSEYGLN